MAIGMAADLANNITNKTKELVEGVIRDANDIAYKNANTFPWSPTMSDGEIEHIISMFSSGSQVTVFSL